MPYSNVIERHTATRGGSLGLHLCVSCVLCVLWQTCRDAHPYPPLPCPALTCCFVCLVCLLVCLFACFRVTPPPPLPPAPAATVCVIRARVEERVAALEVVVAEALPAAFALMAKLTEVREGVCVCLK